MVAGFSGSEASRRCCVLLVPPTAPFRSATGTPSEATTRWASTWPHWPTPAWP